MRNRYQPHVFVLPEDDASRQLANGFINHFAVDQNKIQILPPAGGWLDVCKKFASDHLADMERYPERLMILMIDFDNDAARHEKMHIPPGLRDRIFVIGVLSELEKFKAARSYDVIAHELAENCATDQYRAWDDPLLRHNASELLRLRRLVRPILFSSNA